MSEPVKVRGLQEAIDKLGPELVARPMRNLMNNATTKIANRATVNAPSGVSGDLRKQMATDVDSAYVPLWGRAGTNLFYAPYVELGTKPHWPPPGGSLELWAIRKKVDPQWIRWKIARFGTKPQPFLKPAFEDSKADIDRYITRAAREIEANANGGA